MIRTTFLALVFFLFVDWEHKFWCFLCLFFLFFFDVFGKCYLFFFDVLQNKIEEKMYVLANFCFAAGATHRKIRKNVHFFFRFCFEKRLKRTKKFSKNVEKEQEKKHKNHQNLCSRFFSIFFPFFFNFFFTWTHQKHVLFQNNSVITQKNKKMWNFVTYVPQKRNFKTILKMVWSQILFNFWTLKKSSKMPICGRSRAASQGTPARSEKEKHYFSTNLYVIFDNFIYGRKKQQTFFLLIF